MWGLQRGLQPLWVCESQRENHNQYTDRVAQWYHKGPYLSWSCGKVRQLYRKKRTGESRTERKLDGHHRGYVCGDFGKLHRLCACDRPEGQYLWEKPLHQVLWFYQANLKCGGQRWSVKRAGTRYGFWNQGSLCGWLWIYRADEWRFEYPSATVWCRVSVFYHFCNGQYRKYVGGL